MDREVSRFKFQQIKLSRSYRNKFSKTSMGQKCDNNYRERKLKTLDRQSSYRKVSSFNFRQMKLSRSYREVSTAKSPRWIEKLSSVQKLPRWIKKLLRSYRDKFSKTSMDRNCDNNCRERKIKRLDRQPSCRKVSSSYRDCLKTVFQEEKNIDINAVKHATQPKIQTKF